jgi:hypothetical protein
MTVEDVDGHDLAVGDLVEVVSPKAAILLGTRAKVDSTGKPPGHVDLRWNEHSSGGARHWLVKGEYTRFLQRREHDCALCAVRHVHTL